MKNLSNKVLIIIIFILFSIFLTSVINNIESFINSYRSTLNTLLRDDGSISRVYIDQVDYVNTMITERTRLIMFRGILQAIRVLSNAIFSAMIIIISTEYSISFYKANTQSE
jgi:hypothetical protein